MRFKDGNLLIVVLVVVVAAFVILGYLISTHNKIICKYQPIFNMCQAVYAKMLGNGRRDVRQISPGSFEQDPYFIIAN